jgi:uncharacterized delta-60 repeat protein
MQAIRALVFSLLISAPGAPAVAQIGQMDPGFGTGGVVLSDVTDLDYGYDVHIQANGRIVAVGSTSGLSSSSRNATMFLFHPDGTPEWTYTFDNGVFGCSVPEAFYAMAEEADGNLLAAGYAQFDCGGPQRDFYVIRTNSDGNELLRFDRPVFHGVIENAWDLMVQPDGKVVAVGFSGTNPSDNSTWDAAVARYNSDGSLDTTGFGTGGEVLVDVAGDYDWIYQGALQTDGKIAMVGWTWDGTQYDQLLIRLNPDGSRDASFGTNGIVITDLVGKDHFGRDIVALPGGRLLVVGNRRDIGGDNNEAYLIRYQADGSIDTSFGAGGAVIFDFGGVSAGASGLLIDPEGYIVVSGSVLFSDDETTREFAVARIDSNGAFDPTFGNGGFATIDLAPGQEDSSIGIAVQPDDGAVVVVGYTVEIAGEDEITDFAATRLTGDLELVRIFADGFESGNTSTWAETAP